MFVDILEEAARKGLEQKKMKKGGKVKKKPTKKAHRGDGVPPLPNVVMALQCVARPVGGWCSHG
jgi:hypothetical protein